MSEMNNIKVSIIVPVYNIPEKILRKCIESIINQTLREIEIILVDDGSTDNSGVICDEYAEKDSRIVVIHKANEGLSAARNTGYENATGDWLAFLDSDDWVNPNMCEEVYKLGIKNFADVVIFGTIQEFEHYKSPFKYHFQDDTLFEGKQCEALQCEILDFTGNIATAWAKLFNKKFLDDNNLKHNNQLRQGSEGIEFNIRVFEKVKRVYFTSHIYYHYVYNPNSISAKHDEKNHYLVIKCFEEIKKTIEKSKNRDNLFALYYMRFIYVVIAAAITGYFSPSNNNSYFNQKKGYKKYLNNKLVKETMEKIDNSCLDFQRRIILKCIKNKWFLVIKVLAYVRYIQKHKG